EFIADQPWEVGVEHVHGTGGKTVMEGLISDWETLGFIAGNSYTVQLDAVGQCSSASSLSAKSAHFQVVVLPDNDGFETPTNCPDHPQACCSNFPNCTLYSCSVGTLAEVSAPATDCPIPP